MNQARSIYQTDYVPFDWVENNFAPETDFCSSENIDECLKLISQACETWSMSRTDENTVSIYERKFLRVKILGGPTAVFGAKIFRQKRQIEGFQNDVNDENSWKAHASARMKWAFIKDEIE
ncbi:hypothetical protein TNCV_109341 [Trichonephila clavipes]|nr:hypothetical protein TNCV_109341 [Trichonephila clavipes]